MSIRFPVLRAFEMCQAVFVILLLILGHSPAQAQADGGPANPTAPVWTDAAEYLVACAHGQFPLARWRSAHRLMKLRPSGAGRSRPLVQPPARGRRREPALRAALGREEARHQFGAPAIERRTSREPGPQFHPGAVSPALAAARPLPLAPVAHHLGQRNSHRADALAAPAESRGIGQMAGLIDADQARRQHRAHRPGIDPAIGMAADRAIDRAMVEAGRAADAAQHVLELGAEHRRAAIVEQHDVVFARPVGIARRGAARSRRWYRSRIPGPSPSAPAGAATSRRPPASAPPSRCWPARYAPWAMSASGRHCPRW